MSLAINSKGQVWRELNHNAGSYAYVRTIQYYLIEAKSVAYPELTKNKS